MVVSSIDSDGNPSSSEWLSLMDLTASLVLRIWSNRLQTSQTWHQDDNPLPLTTTLRLELVQNEKSFVIEAQISSIKTNPNSKPKNKKHGRYFCNSRFPVLSLPLHHHSSLLPLQTRETLLFRTYKRSIFHSFSASPIPTLKANSFDIDTSFFDNFNPNDENDTVFNPPEPPEDFVPPPSFDEGPMETEEEIVIA
ncbi:hypothetical protein I3760_10G049800 [Carya illinoinensis]|nr:hypothetical protein I3760_10G049800 [Carya illinoinensis]